MYYCIIVLLVTKFTGYNQAVKYECNSHQLHFEKTKFSTFLRRLVVYLFEIQFYPIICNNHLVLCKLTSNKTTEIYQVFDTPAQGEMG